MTKSPITRRELFRRGGVLGSLLAFPGALKGAAQAATASSAAAAGPAGANALRLGADMYQSIGVRPLINARGTFTIISGSTMLPEVRAAMDAAAQKYVHLDELAEAVGARLATLTGAEWGLVSNGCSAGLTLASAACVAGGNPDLHVRLPNLSGFPKDEAVIPTHSRNVDDAAAEILTIPNVHLQNGATLVAYSGGKCIRGPQTAGLILGRKDLVKAAWVHSAPHHGFTRSLKVGKEDAIGMLMAVEMWVKRDHDAEWKRWTGWLDHISQRVSTVAGVTTTVNQPNGLSNRTPSLTILWDRQKIATTGDTVARVLLDGEPRITLDAARGGPQGSQTGVRVTPYMMAPGDEKIIADRLVAVLSKPPAPTESTTPASAVADVTGQW